jgi:hypothetical protein
MSTPIQIWTSAAFHPAHRCGGWAYARASEGTVAGAAGGERNTTAERTVLAGLAAALRDLPADGAPIDIRTTSMELALFKEALGAPDNAAPPEADRDLWVQVFKARAGRRMTLVRIPVDPDTPSGFTAAWAELARDKAKAGGAFMSPLPRSNLAKAPGLAR